MSKRDRLLAIVLCGVLTGSAFYFLTLITLGLFGTSFVSAVAVAPAYPKMPTHVFIGLDMLMGIWVIWLYSTLAQFRPGRVTAISVATAWWVVKSLQSGKWIGLGFIPTSTILAPLLTSYFAGLGATLVGVFVFDRLRLTASARAVQDSATNAAGTAVSDA